MLKFLNKLKNKTSRLLVLAITLIASLLTITLGTALYTSKNTRTGGAYGGSGEVTVKVTKKDGSAYSAEKVQEIYESIKNHINPTGLKSSPTNSYVSSGGLITFKKAGIKNQEQLDAFVESITNKPRLGVYSTGGSALMKNGNYIISNPFIPSTLSQAKRLDQEFQTPFEPGKATPDLQNGKWVVKVTLKQEAIKQWANLTTAISNSGPKGKDGKTTGGTIALWINYQQLRWRLKNIGFRMSGGRPFSDRDNLLEAIHATLPNGKPAPTLATNKFELNKLGSPKNYLISTAKVQKTLNQKEFVITLGSGGNSDQAKELAEKINYGSSTYEIKAESSMFTPAQYGNTAFKKAMIAGLIVFSLIAIFMIVNYGLLGALSTIGMALYMFLTLTMFTVMRGEYSPETIASLIIGIGMAVDACIITFERLKTEIRSGNSIIKSNKIANKLSLSTIFDSNTTTIIVGFVLFFFGTSQIKGFSIMLILSILFTLLIMLTFVRLLSSLLVNSGILKNKTWLIGVKKQSINAVPSARAKKIMNFDYVKNSKWFTIGSTVVVGVSIIIFSITAGMAGKLSSGFNSSIEFAGGSRFTITNSINNGSNLTSQNAEEIKKLLISKKIVTADEISLIYQDAKKESARLQINSKRAIGQTAISNEIKKDIKLQSTKLDKQGRKIPNKFEIIGGSVTSETAQNLIKEAMIAIAVAFLAIILYTLIRFKWTFSVAAIIALVHDGLIVTAVFIITRIEFSPIFIAGLLSVIGYSINDTIVTFDRVREKFKTKTGILTKAQIKQIANEAIRDTIKRSVLTTLTTISAVFVLLFFGNATKVEFNVAMLAGLISGTYSSIFIATYIWVYLEAWSQKRIAARSKKKFWKLKEKEEQVIVGINDYKD